ncbi:MAG: TatD family hydrolase [Candidatus Aenigmarchaeota archaeon]|nr:TatD family hydrolase [Candidatus Aenigmarchaeota archaeon]
MIDVHCHIDLLENSQEIIDEAKRRGMKAIIVSVADPEELGSAMALRNANKDFVYVCAGFHPNHVNDYDEDEIDEYIEQLRGSRFDIAGIGEIGLDYFWTKDDESRLKQKILFEKFIEFAIEIELPVVVHIRDAFDDALEVLARYKIPNVVLHCFSGSETHLKQALERGYYISFATNMYYTKKHPRLAALTPMKQMLLETDSPWLDPDTPNIPNEEKGKRNRPWNIEKSSEVIADVKKIKKEDVIQKAEENAKHVFRI